MKFWFNLCVASIAVFFVGCPAGEKNIRSPEVIIGKWKLATVDMPHGREERNDVFSIERNVDRWIVIMPDGTVCELDVNLEHNPVIVKLFRDGKKMVEFTCVISDDGRVMKLHSLDGTYSATIERVDEPKGDK